MEFLTDHDVLSLRATLEAWGFRASHADRLLRRFYDGQGSIDYSQVEVGRALQQRLAAQLPPRQSRLLAQQPSSDGTIKILVGFERGGSAEAVLMPAHRPDRAAGCVSSQIGCAMACDFCATARGGLQRQLGAGEIVEQFLHLRQLAVQQGRRLSTLVFMGMGEPLLNLENVRRAIQIIAAPATGHLGGRQITVSTVGIVPGMDQLAEAQLNVHLALSLHAPDDPTRSRLVPANRRWNVEAVMAAARRFQDRTGRIVNVEYCLLDRVNDEPWQAELLAQRMGGFRAHVNLIPYNPIGSALSGATYEPSPAERVDRFVNILRDRGVVAHIRRARGQDIAAACGQLRAAAGQQPVATTLPGRTPPVPG